jgi:hypothetical protein
MFLDAYAGCSYLECPSVSFKTVKIFKIIFAESRLHR